MSDHSVSDQPSQPATDATPNATPGASCCTMNGRKKHLIGMVIMAVIGIALSLWLAFGTTGPSARDRLAAFTATKPVVVVIAGNTAPVITADDVLPAFFSLSDFSSPAKALATVGPLFDAAAPKQVWILADTGWAKGSRLKELTQLVDDLKARQMTTVLVLPPQEDNSVEDETINTLAGLANTSGISFLDYHDGSKLGEPLCVLEDDDADAAMSTEDLATTLTTQQMLLHMAVNAPATRRVLRLADIGARIKKIKTEAQCPKPAPAKE